MKKVKMFYMNGCPYCQNAYRALKELRKENEAYRNVEIEEINELVEVALADSYDYYYVPTFYIDEKKIYECSPQHNYATIKAAVKDVLDQAVA